MFKHRRFPCRDLRSSGCVFAGTASTESRTETGRDDAGARGGGRSSHDHAVSAPLCAEVGEASALVSGLSRDLPTSWRVDETYVKVGGKWKYLFRAVDKHGRLMPRLCEFQSLLLLGYDLRLGPEQLFLTVALRLARPSHGRELFELPCHPVIDLVLGERHDGYSDWRLHPTLRARSPSNPNPAPASVPPQRHAEHTVRVHVRYAISHDALGASTSPHSLGVVVLTSARQRTFIVKGFGGSSTCTSPHRRQSSRRKLCSP